MNTAHRIKSKRVHIIKPDDTTLCGLKLTKDWWVDDDEPTCKKCINAAIFIKCVVKAR